MNRVVNRLAMRSLKIICKLLTVCLLWIGLEAGSATAQLNEQARIEPGAPSVLAGDVWVSPKGDDSHSGDQAQPVLTLTKAIELVKAGHTIWLNPGEYHFTEMVQIPKKKQGTAQQPYRISGLVSGPKPKLNFSGVDHSSEIRGIQVDSQYWHLHYLEIYGASDNNVNIAGSYNLLERLDVHDAGDTGLQINSSSSLMPSFNHVLNCDSYLNADKSAEDADGFAAKLIIGPGNTFEGCRAWHNCDDNWDLYDAQNVVSLKDCWAIAARHPQKSKPNSDGNGFKVGGLRKENSSWNKRSIFASYNDYIKANATPHQLERCFAIGNPAWGFHRNNNPSTEVTCKNCGSWGNGKGDFSEGLLVVGGNAAVPEITADDAINAQRDARGKLPSLSDLKRSTSTKR